MDKDDIESGNGFSQDEVLLMGALSARWENNDAIDQAITSSLGNRSKLDGFEVQRTAPFNPVDKRTTAWVLAANGNEFIATKGAPQVIR